ncbi:hypothetical protein ACOMCP_00557 [Lactiplantibacillus plantarum]|uniref:Uncharacterized protein n=1 Tax=Lactiplantibacillus plantarum TaxID=1590 RepID=A0A1E3KQS1_LACPN|nr:hypothetical protein [Lactiplantibacillus plantarum]MDN7088104.1 hypothetical protein [Lactiplantibacillus plantarum]ODO60621.1 hypothetical protein LPJSA22_00565 [Lactiplantibacillus plantarum]UVW05583.1 hypothetical protein NX849_13000 [Lactiplantibacillus plantarum]UWF35754.1 hypothetical protein NYR24_13000 [Lactiplantibacillus plantarum]
MKPKVGYYISSQHHLPTITVDDEPVWIVSCTYQYLTSGSSSIRGANMLIATTIKQNDNQQHVVTIDQTTGQTWYK